MEENKSILADGVSVGEEYDGSAPAADMTEAPDVAPVTESDTDPAARLREAGDTINRAAKEAESFKRRRAETGYADPTDDEKKREAGEKLPRFRDEIYRIDIENDHFYIPEEQNIAATTKFRKKGSTWGSMMISIVLLTVAFLALLLFLPWFLGQLDGAFGNILGKN